jgi:hypothetical protein
LGEKAADPGVRFAAIRLGSGGWTCLVAGMAHCKGKDNVKKREARRKKDERLKAAKLTSKAS